MFCPLYVGKWSDEKWLPQDNQDGKKSYAPFAMSSKHCQG